MRRRRRGHYSKNDTSCELQSISFRRSGLQSSHSPRRCLPLARSPPSRTLLSPAPLPRLLPIAKQKQHSKTTEEIERTETADRLRRAPCLSSFCSAGRTVLSKYFTAAFLLARGDNRLAGEDFVAFTEGECKLDGRCLLLMKQKERIIDDPTTSHPPNHPRPRVRRAAASLLKLQKYMPGPHVFPSYPPPHPAPGPPPARLRTLGGSSGCEGRVWNDGGGRLGEGECGCCGAGGGFSLVERSGD